jgi:hypothetical protein
MSGNAVYGEKLTAVAAEFENMRILCHQAGKIVFK